MNLLFLVHYPPVAGQSMRAYAELLAGGLAGRGHSCQLSTAPLLLGRLARRGSSLAKWLGYLDQFLLYPPLLRRQLRRLPPATLVVVIDQALGPWIPALAAHPHVVHVHDLLALRCALGQFPQHRLGPTGRLYQRWIRRGFCHGRRFLCVSEATRQDLLPLLPAAAQRCCAVLPNPLLPPFQAVLASAQPHRAVPSAPFLLHIGSTWYKNRLAVLAIAERLWLSGRFPQLQLVMVGQPDNAMLLWLQARPELRSRIVLHPTLSLAKLQALYAQAAALLFPSFAEGFGWPVLEGLASGCAVIATAVAPLTEVGGDAVAYLSPCPPQQPPPAPWLDQAETVVAAVLNRSAAEQARCRQQGYQQAQRFSLAAFLDQLELHYREALQCTTSA